MKYFHLFYYNLGLRMEVPKKVVFLMVIDLAHSFSFLCFVKK